MPTLTATLAGIPRTPRGHAAIGHRPKPERRAAILAQLFAATNGRCTVCGESIVLNANVVSDDNAVIMHIVPSGPNKMGWIAGNLMIGCNACNKADKGADLSEYIPLFALGHTIPGEWQPGNVYATKSDIAAQRKAIRQRLGLPY